MCNIDGILLSGYLYTCVTCIMFTWCYCQTEAFSTSLGKTLPKHATIIGEHRRNNIEAILGHISGMHFATGWIGKSFLRMFKGKTSKCWVLISCSTNQFWWSLRLVALACQYTCEPNNLLTDLLTVLCVFTVSFKDIVDHLCCLGTAKRSIYLGQWYIKEHVGGDKVQTDSDNGLEGALSSNNTIQARRDFAIIRATPDREWQRLRGIIVLE